MSMTHRSRDGVIRAIKKGDFPRKEAPQMPSSEQKGCSFIAHKSIFHGFGLGLGLVRLCFSTFSYRDDIKSTSAQKSVERRKY